MQKIYSIILFQARKKLTLVAAKGLAALDSAKESGKISDDFFNSHRKIILDTLGKSVRELDSLISTIDSIQ